MKVFQNIGIFAVGLVAAAFMGTSLAKAQSAGNRVSAEVAVTPPTFLQLEITSACTDKGAIFKITNRGGKWPRTGFLRLYHADNKSLIGERRLRLAPGQKVSFVVKNKVMKKRPVSLWIEPEWYKREMEYDASIKCN
ncbi:MAG: hypothetical protein OQK24_14435 [Magnetovibrio sp.]|nr:hypothetical protein [Magnetovibrio sp.]